MSSLDIAPRPEGAPTRVQDQCRTLRRLRVSFRRAAICTVWRLGFRQSSFHLARVSRHTVPDTWTRSPVSWHALVPLTFQRRVSHQTQGPPSNPSQLKPGIQRSASRRTTLIPMSAANECRWQPATTPCQPHLTVDALAALSAGLRILEKRCRWRDHCGPFGSWGRRRADVAGRADDCSRPRSTAPGVTGAHRGVDGDGGTGAA
jgi:hypothetical protein